MDSSAGQAMQLESYKGQGTKSLTQNGHYSRESEKRRREIFPIDL